MEHPHFSSTEAVVTALRAVARDHEREMTVTDDIGADQVSRRTSAGAFSVVDPDGSLPHEAFVELGGSPTVTVRVFPEDDATITVDGVEFADVPRAAAPAFPRSVYGGLAHLKGKFFPPGWWLIVSLPGDETYKELVVGGTLSPWLSRMAKTP
ncbi:hypothetical protein [Streptomyces sp. H27-C3]|uniref:hypothetical protein n=1 Tax=Streptomyces sp. H27-C3 TaxID=3046305 RepID=UPI0024B89E02|nr:hypothetical protein [Streptomyces sp. H27-C3]MDJ0463405.1 hypothetical protein [Streptomyces sp. H27-C3]